MWIIFRFFLNPSLSNAERSRKYCEENKKKNELNEGKRQHKRSLLLQNDPEKAKEMKEAARLRKQAQRERKKSEDKENETTEVSQADDSLNNSSTARPSNLRK